MNDFDFDGHFDSVKRQVSTHMWIASIIGLVWSIGCIGVVSTFLWLIGHLAGAW